MNLDSPALAPFLMPLAALAAVLVDRLLGEPRRWHPLVGFGRLAGWLEGRLNRRRLPAGLVAWLLAVAPWVALAGWLRPVAPFAVDVALLYFARGARSLAEHAEAVARPLRQGRLDEARQRVGWMVSRDTAGLDEGPRGSLPARMRAQTEAAIRRLGQIVERLAKNLPSTPIAREPNATLHA